MKIMAGSKNWKIGIDDELNAKCYADTDDGMITAIWHGNDRVVYLEYEGEVTDYADKWFRKWLKDKNIKILN